jgi:protein O-GlcNAc transferase
MTAETSIETTAQALSIAVGLHEAGAHDRAELLLRKVLAVDGFNPLALYALGRVLRALGMAGEAMEPLSLCRSLLPDSAPVAVACAGALAELLRFAEAVELLDGLLSRLPDGAGEEVRSVEDALKSILALAGDQANQRGDDGEAIGFYRRLAERSPDDAAVWGTLGAILLRSGAWLEAEAPLRRAAELDPGDDGHTCRLADALKYQGRLEEVREVYRGLWVPRRAGECYQARS